MPIPPNNHSRSNTDAPIIVPMMKKERMAHNSTVRGFIVIVLAVRESMKLVTGVFTRGVAEQKVGLVILK